ncbi:proclotting enzyme-like isoform X1 [Euwallacea fornicatus]|uniref:proclotting enzyme-like isoform X1 n=1 Tax=Euwallacea fornicatus TaxID=995702 RepID=UPI00338E96BC
MGTVIHVCLFLLVQVVVIYCIDNLDTPNEYVPETLSQSHTKLSKRDSKQFILQPAFGYPLVNYIPQVQQIPVISPLQGATAHIPTTGPCYNAKGEVGTCVQFRKCYPHFKVPAVGNFDSWLLAMYDACSYYTEEGRQIFGVCCASVPEPNDTSTELSIGNSDNSTSALENVMPELAKIPNWPPPLPTHPPDHTIPPLPTHPPSPNTPAAPSTPLIPSLIITTKATTKKPTNKPVTTKPTTQMPSYDFANPACGAKNGVQDQGKIVGGHNADINEWPWIAALFNGGRQFCGGSLIDNIHILSAAHCVAHMSSWDVARLTVRLGDYNIKTNSEVRHVEKRVKRVVRHRGFDPRTLYNDIAILTLDSPIDFNSMIRPVCLPSGGTRDWAGSTGTVIGWGSLRESGPQPAILQEVNIPIWGNLDCKQKYGLAAPGGIVEHMLCAGKDSKDSCSGDSGGPLMVENGRWTQVGIVSWGIGCGKGQYPGVYTRVEKFLPWINKNLKQ